MKKVNIFVVVVFILSLVAFFVTLILFTTRVNEKEKRIVAEEENALLISKNEDLIKSVQELTAKENDLNSKLSKQLKMNQELKEQFEVAHQQREKALNDLSGIQTQLDKSREEFANYKMKTADIIKDFKDQNQKLLAKVEQLETQTIKYPAMPQNTGASGGAISPGIATQPGGRTDVVLPKVVVTPQPSRVGKVIVVNQKYNFVISNLGRVNGVKVGDSLIIYRDNVRVGSARVEKLYDNLSASGIVDVSRGYVIQEGDLVQIQ